MSYAPRRPAWIASRFLGSLFALGLLTSPAAWAVPISAGPTGEPVDGDVYVPDPFLTDSFGEPVWFIGDGPFSFPLGFQKIGADPDAAPWEKILVSTPTDNGATTETFNDSQSLFKFGDSFLLIEALQIGAGPAWTDWHESIQTPGWAWGLGDAANPNFKVTVDGADIRFDFHPSLAVDSLLLFSKTIECVDINGCYVGSDPGNGIVIHEFPTTAVPEPSTLALLGISLAVLGWVGRHRKKIL